MRSDAITGVLPARLLAQGERGLDPAPTAPVGADAARLRARWLAAAERRGDFSLAGWDPSQGYRATAKVVHAIYRYYGLLWRQHPYLEWASMGNLIAPTFLAGIQDAAMLGDAVRPLRGFVGALPEGVRRALAGAAQLSGAGGAAQLEVRLLRMQQQIFTDQAMMHEAYVGGGMPAILELREVGLIDDLAVWSWRQIDRGRREGDRELLHAGTTGLVWREQMQVIDDDYDAMRRDGLLGPLLTRLLTSVAGVSIPGARTPVELDGVRLGRAGVSLLDISQREDRWRLIAQDTMVALFGALDTQRTHVTRTISTPVELRAGR